jgi:hypothetical protein
MVAFTMADDAPGRVTGGKRSIGRKGIAMGESRVSEERREAWKAIVRRMVELAQHGNLPAFNWICDRILGS